MAETKKFFGLAVDPLHVGSGGYRLGRVDNTIVREPGTNLPKIPGSSLSGVCRNYAIYGLSGMEKIDAKEGCAEHLDLKVRNNCGKCAICKTFGFASGEDKRNQAGLIKFFDASIVAFPVATMYGPIWVTTSRILSELGDENALEPNTEDLIASFDVPDNKLNLGWLYLNTEKREISLSGEAQNLPQLTEINNRLVVAPEYLFSEIVNNNLEVRTSVSIDFETGAAKSGALFTYEAIPRSTLLAFDLVINTFRCNSDHPVEKVWEIVVSGFELFKVMGLGGMNTRGFGRMKVAEYNKKEGDL